MAVAAGPLPEMCGMLGKPWDLVERPLLRPVSEHHQELRCRSASCPCLWALWAGGQDADVQGADRLSIGDRDYGSWGQGELF